MADKVEQIGESVIQHGRENNRVYIMKLKTRDFAVVLQKSESLCRKYGYTKIFAKVPESFAGPLMEKNFRKEAVIPRFYRNGESCAFMGKFLDPDREYDVRRELIDRNIKTAKEKKPVPTHYTLQEGFSIGPLNDTDVEEMASVYSQVFDSYPFPINDPSFLKETMGQSTEYCGIRHQGELVALASAEINRDDLNAEMTDFATLENWRGHSLALSLLFFLERRLRRKGFRTLYTIARAMSPGMNITFGKAGYLFCGTMVSNTNIAGGIESMNIWYKSIRKPALAEMPGHMAGM